VLPDRISVSGSLAQSQTLTVGANFDEPFPYSVRVSTADGGSWLNANRVTGFTGNRSRFSVNPAGLARGSYRGTVAVVVRSQSAWLLRKWTCRCPSRCRRVLCGAIARVHV